MNKDVNKKNEKDLNKEFEWIVIQNWWNQLIQLITAEYVISILRNQILAIAMQLDSI